jgi:hypothetical protein
MNSFQIFGFLKAVIEKTYSYVLLIMTKTVGKSATFRFVVSILMKQTRRIFCD